MTGWTKEKAAKWDKYDPYAPSSKPSQGNGWSPEKAAKWDKYDPYATAVSKGDSWGALAVKAPLKGASSFLDIPKAIASGLDWLTTNPAGIPDNPLEANTLTPTNLADYIPGSADAREQLKQYTGLDLEPNPSSYEQRIFSHGAELGGSLIGSGLLGNLAKAASPAQKFLGTAKGASGIARQGALGGTLGTASGVLQEEGVDPLTADIASALTVPTAGTLLGKAGATGKNLLGYFSKAGRQQALDTKAGNILRANIGEKSLPRVMERLEGTMPLGTKPVTAELAQNVGLSKLHQALEANNPQVLERQALNDEIMRNELAGLTPYHNLESYDTGKAIRSDIQNQHKTLIENRALEAEPLYENLRQVKYKIDAPKINTYIDQELPDAVGGKKTALQEIKKLITDPIAESQLKSIEKKYIHLSPEAREAAKREVQNKVTVAKLSNIAQDLRGEIDYAYEQGNRARARYLTEIREEILKDLEVVPEEMAARKAYADRSPDINAIEEQPLLKKFVQLKGSDQPLAPEKITQTILSRSTSIDDVNALMNQIKSNPETIQNLRGGVMRELLGKTQLSSSNAFGQENLSYDKVKKFLESNKPKLRIIFEPEQLKVLEDVRDILRKRNVAASMGRARGSVTQSETTLLANLASTSADKFIREGLGYAVPGGGLLYEAGTRAYRDAYNQALQDLLKEALADPNKAKLLLSKTKKPLDQKTMDFLLQGIYQTTPAVLSSNLSMGGEQ